MRLWIGRDGGEVMEENVVQWRVLKGNGEQLKVMHVERKRIC